MQAQIVTAAAAHPKTLHARNAANQQVQQVLHSHLYSQTGHYATPKEMSVALVAVFIIIVLAAISSIAKKLG